MPDPLTEAMAEALRPFAEAAPKTADEIQIPSHYKLAPGFCWGLGHCDITFGDLRKAAAALAAYDAAKQERRYGMEYENRDKFEQKQD